MQDKNDSTSISEPTTEAKQLLDWRKFLYNESTQVEVTKFNEWNKILNIPKKDQDQLIRDLNRVRNSEQFFKKEKTQKNLQLIATFYCSQNNVRYMQGLLEIVAPFLSLRTSKFTLGKCYAYFNAFMNNYYPQVLKTRQPIEERDNEYILPHFICATTLCKVLLKYHSPRLLQILEKNDVKLDSILPQNTEMQAAVILLDQYLKRSNCNYLFYLAISLILLKEEKIIELGELEDNDQILNFCNRNIKELKSEKDVFELFKRADILRANTPVSFEKFVSDTGFPEHTILSIEDINNMLHLNFPQDLIPLFPEEALQSCIKRRSEKFPLSINFIDFRNQKRKQAIPLPNSVPFSLDKLIKQNNNEFMKSIQKFLEKDQFQSKIHLAYVVDSLEEDQQMNALKIADQQLSDMGACHISLLSDAKQLEILLQKAIQKNELIGTSGNSNSVCAIF